MSGDTKTRDGGPEPCLNHRCWSPIACGAFGYCRERNQGRAVKDVDIIERRKLAADAMLEQRAARSRDTGE